MDKKALKTLGISSAALSLLLAVGSMVCWCILAAMKIKELRNNEEFTLAAGSVFSRFTQGFNKMFWKKEIDE